jgi:hypothetical protein
MTAERLHALGFGHHRDPEALILEGSYLRGVLDAVALMTNSQPQETIRERVKAGTAALAVIEAAAGEMTGAVGLVTKSLDTGETILRLDLQVLRPIDPAVADTVAAAMEWTARSGAVPTVRIVADGPFPCPHAYVFEDLGAGRCAMTKRSIQKSQIH